MHFHSQHISQKASQFLFYCLDVYPIEQHLQIQMRLRISTFSRGDICFFSNPFKKLFFSVKCACDQQKSYERSNQIKKYHSDWVLS